MNSSASFSRVRRLPIAGVVLVLVLGLVTALRAQTGRGDHWVGTWATAVVARPQGPPAPAAAPAGSLCAPPVFGPGPGRQGGGPPPVPPAPHQLLEPDTAADRPRVPRRRARPRRAEQRVWQRPARRRGGPRRASDEGRGHRSQVGSHADLRGQSHGDDCGRRRGRVGPGEPPGACVRGSRHRRVPARGHRRVAVAADDARRSAADELRVDRRQSCR